MLGCLAGNFGTVIVHGDEINKTVARSPGPDSAKFSASIIGGTGGQSVDPGYLPLFILVLVAPHPPPFPNTRTQTKQAYLITRAFVILERAFVVPSNMYLLFRLLGYIS